MKKIMFNDRYCLTKAVLDGRKTMTRRAIKLNDGCSIDSVTVNGRKIYYFKNESVNEHGSINGVNVSNFDGFVCAKAQYQVGEVVAIAQSYYDCGVCLFPKIKDENGNYEPGEAGDYNKMFVKAELMPHHIRITNIRVERLQDISDEDCLREGVRLRSEPSKYQEVWSLEYTFGNGKYHAKYPRAAFAALIDCISGKGTWERNPYVFVYEFERVTKTLTWKCKKQF